MRWMVLVGLLVSAPAIARGLNVTKTVTKLDTTDKTVTPKIVQSATPVVTACFDDAVELDVTVTVEQGKIVSVKTPRAKATVAACVEGAFKKMKTKGTYTAVVHIKATLTEEEAKFRTIAVLDTHPSTNTSVFSGSGAGSGVAGDFQGTGLKKDEPSSKVTVGALSGDLGSHPEEELIKVIRARAGVLHACYDKERQHTPKLEGRFTYVVHIDASGRVTSAKAKSRGNADLDSCVARQLQMMKFAAKDPASFEVPLTFSPPV